MQEHKIIKLQWSVADDEKVKKFIAETHDINDLSMLIEQIPYRTQCAIKNRVRKFKYNNDLSVKKTDIKQEKVQQPTAKIKLDNLYMQLDSTGILDPNYSELLNQINNLEITITNQERWKSHST